MNEKSDNRRSSSTPPSPRKSVACAACGFPNTAPPPSPTQETRELNEALHQFELEARGNLTELPARSALLALYTRQREEIEELIEQLVEDTRQLERLKAEQQEAEDSVASWRRLYVEERDALDLIAMRDTLTDVCQLLDGWHQDGTAWTKWDEEVRQRASTQLKSVYAKLRRLSSDSGTGGEKE